MLSIFSPLCFAILFIFFKATTTSPSTSNVSPTKLNRTLQKSSDYCYSNHECSSSLGAYSTCVDGSCVCDLGYKIDSITLRCAQIDCLSNSDCPQYNTECSCGRCSCKSGYHTDTEKASCTDSCTYSHECPGINTRCDYLSRVCVCGYGYHKKDGSVCVKDGCTFNSDCPGENTRCDYLSQCVCDYGYEMSFGSCTSIYGHGSSGSGSGLGIGFGVGGFLVISVICFVLRIICRAQKQSTRRRVVPVNGRPAQQTAVPVPSVPQSELRIPAGYQAGYQPQAPMFPEPYGNLEATPPPAYSETYNAPTFPVVQTHPQPAVQPPTYEQPSAPKI